MITETAGSYHYYVVWTLVAVCRTSNGFNVDMSTASLRHGEEDSMFGFTVAQHVDHDQKWSVEYFFFLSAVNIRSATQHSGVTWVYNDRTSSCIAGSVYFPERNVRNGI